MKWIDCESTVRPNELDITSSKVYNYVRKDIEEEEREIENPEIEEETEEKVESVTITMYTYKELKILKEDWELFQQVNESSIRIEEIEDAVIELAELIG